MSVTIFFGGYLFLILALSCKEKYLPFSILSNIEYWQKMSVYHIFFSPISGLWLNTLGMSAYAPEIRKCCKDGNNLLAMTYNDLDIKLGIKNHLHRKKLFLALRARNNEYSGPEKMTFNLESNWVVTWLDDIGLPQYKERFLEAKIDIRVLNFITTEDLCTMKITNLLHHLSIKRGIQVLRKCNFDPSCLKRRTSPNTIPDLTQQVRIKLSLGEAS